MKYFPIRRRRNGKPGRRRDGSSWRSHSVAGHRRLAMEALEDRRLLSSGTLYDYDYSDVSIPDNGGFTNKAVSDIYLSGAPGGAVVTDVDVEYWINHTYVGDLKVYLTTERNGTWYDHLYLWNREGGSTDDIHEKETGLDTWDGLNPNGTWYLVAGDFAGGDVGEIDGWRIWVDWMTPPGSPGTPDLDSSDDTGYSSSDNITYQTSNLSFSWSAASSAEGYYYEWNDSTPDNFTTSQSVSISAPSGNGWHRFYVQSWNSAGRGGTSYLDVYVDRNRPSVTNLDLRNSDDSGFSSTDNVTNDTNVRFTWSGNSNGGSGIYRYWWGWDPGDISNSTSSTYRDVSPPSSNGAYTFYVEAEAVSGLWGYYPTYSDQETVTWDTLAPSVPENLHVDGGSPTTDRTPVLDWNSVSGAYRYFVEVEDYWGSNYESGYSSSSDYQVQNDLPFDTIYWKVKALDLAGNDSGYSARASFDVIGTGTVESSLANTSGVPTPSTDTRLVLNTLPPTTIEANPATFSEILEGDYWLEGWYTGSPFGDEFWSTRMVAVNSGETTTANLQRDEPYAYGFTAKDGTTNVTGGIVDAGTSLTYEVDVTNDSPWDRQVRTKLWVDRNASDPFDFSATSSPQTLNDGTTGVFSFSDTVDEVGTHQYRLEIQTLVNTAWITTDTWLWNTAFTVQEPVGSVNASLRDTGGSQTPSGETQFVLQTTPAETLAGNPVTFSDASIGDYWLEGWYTGSPFGDEFWSTRMVTVESGQTTTANLQRDEPYAYDFAVKEGVTDVTGGIVGAGASLTYEVDLTNESPWDRQVRTKLWVDRDATGPFDFAATSSSQTLNAGTDSVFSFSDTIDEVGTHQYRLEVQTWVNTQWVTTDTWLWNSAVTVAPVVTLDGAVFDQDVYRHGDEVEAEFTLHNQDSQDLEGLHIEVAFQSPDGTSVGSFSSGDFDLPGNSSHDTGTLSLWTVVASATSGGYLPIVTLIDDSGHVLQTYSPEDEGAQLPVLPIGNFPSLGNVIVKSQQHFSPDQSTSVDATLAAFAAAGVNGISLSVKLDDGEGAWGSLSPMPGQVLFDSAHATASAVNPLPYDLYAEAVSAGSANGVSISLWFPTFYDEAALTDHPEWELALQDENFIDAYRADVRAYEQGLIEDVIASPYPTPSRIYLDHFRFTNDSQHTYQQRVDSITAFAQGVDGILPGTTQLAGYVWLPGPWPDGDTWWSGQDYTELSPYLEVFAPMLYWNWLKLAPGEEDIPEAARAWVDGSLDQIEQYVAMSRVSPVFGISSGLDFSDGSSTVLDFVTWKQSQLNVLGAAADAGVPEYDLFYWQNWLYEDEFADGGGPTGYRWIDWANYFDSLSRDNDTPTVDSISDTPDPVTRPNQVTLEAQGVDDPDGSVVSVAFYRETNGTTGLQTGAGGDALVGTDGSASGGWMTSFSTAGLPVGTYTYYAQATDDEGATSPDGTSAPSTTNTVQNAAPTIASLSDTPDPVTRADQVTLEAHGVDDPDGSVASVAFYRETNGTAGLQTGGGGDTLIDTDGSSSSGWKITFSTSGLPADTYTYYAQATDAEGATSASGTSAASTVNTVKDPVVVENVVVNDGNDQRSMVTSLTVSFSDLVIVDAGAFELIQRGTGSTVDVLFGTEDVGGKTIATLTFDGALTEYGSLVDGHYQLTIRGDRIHDRETDADLDGDGDGLVGGNHEFGEEEIDAFFRFFGDWDGDRDVDNRDFLKFRGSFRQSDPDPAYLWYFDFDGDGDVDNRDFLKFRSRFRQELPFI